MSFLPEEDQEFLQRKNLTFQLLTGKLPDGGVRRAILFSPFEFESRLVSDANGSAGVPCRTGDVLVIVPTGYATTQLDSFYTSPFLRRADGTNPDRAHSTETHFGRTWQFWSRHLTKEEWRVGIDGLETYVQYIRAALKKA